ncbi:MAG: class I SAM-dependent methyltransferase [Proteobacteria bacterium]|nr:class I SAM-dependent methyltransferase [Pseudomonadota bacterium]
MKFGRGKQLWDLMAFFYDQFFKQFPPYQKLQKEIIENLNSSQNPADLVLDAGCGTGIMSIELAERGYFVVGVDRSLEMLERARNKKERKRLDNLFFLERDLNNDFNLPEYSFNKIFMIHSLYLMNDPKATLQKLASFLPQGGELVMCNPCRRLTFKELWKGGYSFIRESTRKNGFLSILFFLPITLAMGTLNFVIQHRKKKQIFHRWEEKEISNLLKSCGFQVKWLEESCLANSHLLLCAVKE